jgi:septum formation protein
MTGIRIIVPDMTRRTTIPPLHLASGSPRRRELLRSLGLEFSYGGEDIDERQRSGEAAADMVLRLADEKAAAAEACKPGYAVLGADTAVVLDERVFGKPATRDEALAMLLALSGRTHRVMTGVALRLDGHMHTALSVSSVRFRELSDAEARAYWRSGEADDKAGAYALQGLAAVFAEELRGSYSGVVGLPVFETAALLRDAGIDVLRRTCGSGD